MSKTALVVAFLSLAVTMVFAVLAVTLVMIADHNPDLIATLSTPASTQETDVSPKLPLTDKEIQLQKLIVYASIMGMDRDDIQSAMSLANKGKPEWIASEHNQRILFCIHCAMIHYPDRSDKKIGAISGVLLNGLDKLRLKDMPMNTGDLAFTILSLEGESIEIEANRLIQGF